jgi:hypothetical protein
MMTRNPCLGDASPATSCKNPRESGFRPNDQKNLVGPSVESDEGKDGEENKEGIEEMVKGCDSNGRMWRKRMKICIPGYQHIFFEIVTRVE